MARASSAWKCPLVVGWVSGIDSWFFGECLLVGSDEGRGGLELLFHGFGHFEELPESAHQEGGGGGQGRGGGEVKDWIANWKTDRPECPI